MKRTIDLQGAVLSYELLYKKVKNINLRIKPGGEVCVSAPKGVPLFVIENFLKSRTDFIKMALEKTEMRQKKPLIPYCTEQEIRNVILSLCEKVYPIFAKRGVAYPQIKFRKMVSCWGNCRSQKGIVTFNTQLMFAPPECVEYVVLHEFTHFLQANHSAKFYEELSKVCPDWKERRCELKEIQLR